MSAENYFIRKKERTAAINRIAQSTRSVLGSGSRDAGPRRADERSVQINEVLVEIRCRGDRIEPGIGIRRRAASRDIRSRARRPRKAARRRAGRRVGLTPQLYFFFRRLNGAS
jgi:hypothetical protein